MGLHVTLHSQVRMHTLEPDLTWRRAMLAERSRSANILYQGGSSWLLRVPKAGGHKLSLTLLEILFLDASEEVPASPGRSQRDL
jgi:hypothetical protein